MQSTMDKIICCWRCCDWWLDTRHIRSVYTHRDRPFLINIWLSRSSPRDSVGNKIGPRKPVLSFKFPDGDIFNTAADVGDRRRTGINILLRFNRGRMDTCGWVGPAGGSGLVTWRASVVSHGYVRLSMVLLKVFIRQTDAGTQLSLLAAESVIHSVIQSVVLLLLLLFVSL